MYAYFEELFNLINTRDIHIYIIEVYLGLHALVLLLRVFACMAYRSSLVAFRMDAKDMRAREDIKKIRNGPLRKIAAEYIRVADKSVSRIPASAIVNRQVDTASLLGWRLVSVMPFVETLEIGLLIIGLIAAISFGEYGFMYGVLAASGFALLKLIGAFFDFRAARALWADELLIYTEREIGHFFAADSTGAILRLKNELADAIAKQTAGLRESIDGIGEKLASAVDRKLPEINAAIQANAQAWEKSLGEASRMQNAVNAASERMQSSGASLMSASDLLARHLQGYSGALSDQLTALISAVDSAKESNEQVAAAQEAFAAHTRFIERNQETLDKTVQSYEAALQTMAQSLGDGVGAYVKMHAQAATQAVNESFAVHVERATAGNAEMMRHLQSLFDQLREQSKDISANLLSLHEKLSVLERRVP